MNDPDEKKVCGVTICPHVPHPDESEHGDWVTNLLNHAYHREQEEERKKWREAAIDLLARFPDDTPSERHETGELPDSVPDLNHYRVQKMIDARRKQRAQPGFVISEEV